MPTNAFPGALIFDLDGTLVDTQFDIYCAVRQTLQEFALAGPEIGPVRVKNLIGKGTDHMWRTILQDACPQHGSKPITDELISKVRTQYLAHYRQINGEQASVYQGVYDTLDRLVTRGVRLACVTNKPKDLAQDLLQKKYLDVYFSHVHGGDCFSRRKPDPLPLLRTCEEMGTEPHRTLMIGDSSNDAKAARAAGCPLILMTYGYNHGENIRAEPALAHLNNMKDLFLLKFNTSLELTCF